MRCASSWLTRSRALTSISRKVALAWDAFHACISRRISSLSSLKLFSFCIFSLLFPFCLLYPSKKMKPSPIFPVLPMLCVGLSSTHKAFPILPLFPLSGDLPVQKNDVHPLRVLQVDNYYGTHFN